MDARSPSRGRISGSPLQSPDPSLPSAEPRANDQRLVLHQPDGNWFYPDAVTEMIFRRARCQVLERITVHGQRHIWATLALQAAVGRERFGRLFVAITPGICPRVDQTLHDVAATLVARIVTDCK